MEMYIIIPTYIAYCLFASASIFWSQSMNAPTFTLSAIERKLWKDKSPIAFSALIFIYATQFNIIATLIYIGIRTEWWYPLVLGAATIPFIGLVGKVLENYRALQLLGIVSFATIPVIGTILWLII